MEDMATLNGRRKRGGTWSKDAVVVKEQKIAYRFVPLKPDGLPLENSRYTTITPRKLQVGDVIEQPMLGYDAWEVVKIHSSAYGYRRGIRSHISRWVTRSRARLRAREIPQTSLLSVRDASGADVPVAGTLFCRGIGQKSSQARATRTT